MSSNPSPSRPRVAAVSASVVSSSSHGSAASSKPRSALPSASSALPRRPCPLPPSVKAAAAAFDADEKEPSGSAGAGGGGKKTAFVISHSSATRNSGKTKATADVVIPAANSSAFTSPSSSSSAPPPASPRRRLAADPPSPSSVSMRTGSERPSSASVSSEYEASVTRGDSLLHVSSFSSMAPPAYTRQPSFSPPLTARSQADASADSPSLFAALPSTRVRRSGSSGSGASSAQSSASSFILPSPALSSFSSPSALPRESDAEFETLDSSLTRSATYTELFRIVRWCAAQTSVDRMVTTFEMQLKSLLNANAVRLFLLHKHGLLHYSTAQPVLPAATSGIVGWTYAHRQLLHLQHPAADPRWVEAVDAIHERPEPSACLYIALEGDVKADCNAQRETVGVVQVIREREGEAFSARDCRVLCTIAELLANVVKNANSVDRAHSLYLSSLQSNRRSNALLDVAKALASETSLDRIVSIIVSQVPELLDSDRCTLYFVDKERQELIVTKGASKGRPKGLVSWIFGQSNAPELPFPVGANELRFPITSGLAGHVASTGETLNIADAHTDPRFNSLMDKETGYRTRSSLCVPMIDGLGVIIGVVQAINKSPLYPRFDREDETLLKTFSAQAALAVRNSQLFQRTSSALRQSDALLEVTQALSSELKIEALISIICSKVQSLLDSERCTVFIVDRERKELYTTESMSYGMGPSLPIDHDKATLISFPMDRGIAGAVASTGCRVNIPDAYRDSRFNQTMDKETGFRTRSILCMAIKNHRGEIAGVLQVMNKKEGTFDEDDEKLLSAFCAQAAVAIENSRLFQQTERALNHALADQRNLKFMLSVTKNLFSDLHLTSMIDQMTMQVHHLLKADDCALYLVDEEKREFWLAKEEEEGTVRKFPFLTGIVGVVASTADTIRISSHAHADPRFSSLVDQRRGKVTHSILCCPIKAELPEEAAGAAEGSSGASAGSGGSSTKVVGVISVRDEKDRGGFEQEEEKLLRVFCAQAAVAIMNSKRFSSIMEQSEVKESDHSAADYLKVNRGMNLASDDINDFQFRTEEIVMKGAIGTGSYGEVYRAMVRGKIVAVKKLHVRNLRSEQIDSFCQEASLMCQLNHPNIVGFIGAVTEPSNLCIITQFCFDPSVCVWLADGTTKRVDQLLPTDQLLDELGEAISIVPNSLIGTVTFPQPSPGQPGHAAGSQVPTPVQGGYVPPPGTTTVNPGYLPKRRICGVASGFNDFIVSDNHPLTVGTSRAAHAGSGNAKIRRAQAYHFPADCNWQVGQAPAALVGQPISGYTADTRQRGGWGNIRPYYWEGGLDPLTGLPYAMGGAPNGDYRDPRAGPLPVGGWPTWQAALAAQIADWNFINQRPGQHRLGEYPVHVIEAMPPSMKGCLMPNGQWTGQLALVKLSVPVVFPVNNYVVQKLDLAMLDAGLSSGLVDGVDYTHHRFPQLFFRAAQLERALRLGAAARPGVYAFDDAAAVADRRVMDEQNYRNNDRPNQETANPDAYQAIFPPTVSELNNIANFPTRLARIEHVVEYMLEVTSWLVGLWLTDGDSGGAFIQQSLMTEDGVKHGIHNDHSGAFERCRHWIYLLGLPGNHFEVQPAGLGQKANQTPSSRLYFHQTKAAVATGTANVLLNLLVRCGVVVPPVNQQRAQVQATADRLNKPRFWDAALPNCLGWQNETVRNRRAILAGVIDGGGTRDLLDQWSFVQDVQCAPCVAWVCTMFRQLGFSTGEPSLTVQGKMLMQSIQHHYDHQRLLPIATLHKRTVPVGVRFQAPHACSFHIEHDDHQGNPLVPGPVVSFEVQKPGRPCSHRLLLADGTIQHNCNRGSLADLLLEGAVDMNFQMKTQFALDAALGMLYLHNSNPVILHRDLKSDNLLVAEDWTVKVADFGLTRFISEKKQMTQVGTPMWMAPEIIMGRKYTEKADVYAFGIILWEILTREEPYEEKEPMQIVVEVVNEGLRPTVRSELLDSPLVPLMRDCWHTEPTSRPTFEKIVERLRSIKDAIPLDDNSEHGIAGTSRKDEQRRPQRTDNEAAS